MNQLKHFTIATIVALLMLPGSAFAGYILELNTLNGGDDFASGTMFSDPTGYGFDLTISSLNALGNSPMISNFTPGEGAGVGLGVVGDIFGTPGGSALGFLEALVFEFSPDVLLDGFAISVGSNETVRYSALTPLTAGLANIPGGNPSYLIDFDVLASSLEIENLSPKGQFRVSELHFDYGPVVCVDCSPKPVPEPSIIALFAAGILGLGFARRRMRS